MAASTDSAGKRGVLRTRDGSDDRPASGRGTRTRDGTGKPLSKAPGQVLDQASCGSQGVQGLGPG
jgi:hypothetical protein